MPSSMPRVLLRRGAVLSSDRPDATALLTVGETVAWVGDEDEAATHLDEADTVVDLDGRLVTPGFVDAHVHVAKTGLALQSLDLSLSSSVTDALDRLAGYAAEHHGAVLFAHGWDETTWPECRPFTGAEVDRAVGNRVAYVSRVDSHSAVVSTALVERDPSIRSREGWRGDGVVERDSHHAARAVTDALWTVADRERALLTALQRAAEVGLVSVHDANAPHISPFDDISLISHLRSQTPLPEVVSYWGALLGGEHAEASGLAGFAGDLCIDGALGSRTAALHAPYADATNSSGHVYLDEVQVCEHVVWCTERGVQAGFHVIGDRGLDTAVAGLQQAADKIGAEAIVAARHRLEHVEMPSPAAVSVIAALGVVASVQPAFDAAWAATGGLYEQRLGAERAAPMNPFASMRRAGIRLAFGSDSPVTPLSPWAAVRAAVHHHNPDEALSPLVAFAAHTQGGHAARRDDTAGVLSAGAPASYAVWDRVPQLRDRAPAEWFPEIVQEADLPTCVRTVVAGTTVFDTEEV
jgi:predicted amidohydrolase YtcJ